MTLYSSLNVSWLKQQPCQAGGAGPATLESVRKTASGAGKIAEQRRKDRELGTASAQRVPKVPNAIAAPLEIPEALDSYPRTYAGGSASVAIRGTAR
jgi:hypothetical protein